LEWQLTILIIFGSLFVLMASGMFIAFCFMLISVIGVYLLFGGISGLEQLILSIYSTLATFTLAPIPLFILMGEVMFFSGLGTNVIDTLDKWMGRLPGRLALISVGAGTILATLTGVSISSTALLGSLLLPEMEKRGYKKPMTMGPIMGSGGLAIMIPPSGLAVFLGAIAEISIGKLLIAIIIPGLLMAVVYSAYIIIRCWLQPSIAPTYDVVPTPLSQKLVATAKHLVPIGAIIFLVIGVIILGVATPSEGAATGTLGVFILALVQRRLTMDVVKKSVNGTLMTCGMLFLVLCSAKAFSQILSFTGATQGMAEFAIHLQVHPLFVFAGMQIIILILGCFINVDAIILLTMPIFMMIVSALSFDRVWFGTISLINLEMALITPPFGLCLFVMKGVSPPGTTMEDVYRAALPFIGLQLLIMAAITLFPQIALWLPSMMVAK
jgi:tripartite ATP-independent transporter DctM subunit